MKILKYLAVFGVVVLLAFAFWEIYKPDFRRFYYHSFKYTPEKYRAELVIVKSKKDSLRKELENEPDIEAKAKIIERSGGLFTKSFYNQLMPYWYGTAYDFYGKTRVPGQGKIACGYFVTTVLEDMGVPLDRVGLAESASEVMIKNLVMPESITRYSKASLEAFVSSVKQRGNGLYIVGLDTHTGFILVSKDSVQFIHASGRYPFCVLNESAMQSVALEKSKYRVIGKLTDDVHFIENWLKQ
jgi:membrane-bound ClpP family serine protease